MAIQVTEDLVLGASHTVEFQASTMQRIFFVQGLTPGSDTLYSATGAQDAATGLKVPGYAQAHEKVPGLYVTRVFAEPFPGDSTTSVRVTVTYSWHFFGTGIISVKINGVAATLPANHAPDPNTGQPQFFQVAYTPSGRRKVNQTVAVEALVPHIELEIMRQETGSPLIKSSLFSGAINADVFQAGDPGQWLCRSIGGYALLPKLWMVTYCFEYAFEGWHQYYFYKDPVSGKMPTDISITSDNSNGIYDYAPRSAPFSDLAIPNLT